MFGTNQRTKQALEANNLVHDAVLMSIADKYINEEDLANNDFGLQLLGRALNWAVPNPGYNFEKDLDKVENTEFKNRLRADENQIFQMGLKILNSDTLIEQLVAHYVAYEIHLLEKVSPKNTEERYPGIVRMKKFLSQSTEKEPNVSSPAFKENYKNLFISFNDKYGKYGKTLKQETVNSLFSLI